MKFDSSAPAKNFGSRFSNAESASAAMALLRGSVPINPNFGNENG